jgi:hypothetical protein
VGVIKALTSSGTVVVGVSIVVVVEVVVLVVDVVVVGSVVVVVVVVTRPAEMEQAVRKTSSPNRSAFMQVKGQGRRGDILGRCSAP